MQSIRSLFRLTSLGVLSFFLGIGLGGCTMFGGGGGDGSPVHPSTDGAASQELSIGLSGNLVGSSPTQRPNGFIVVLKDVVRDVGVAAADLGRVHGLTVGHTFKYALKGFAADVPPGRLASLRSDGRVESVEPDFSVAKCAQVLPWGINRIDADVSPTAQAGDGTGSVTGVRIYVIDTGVQIGHPDLNRVGGVDFTGVNGTGDDGDGHGTHVAGIAAATDDTGFVVGVAPGAEVFAVKVLDDNGSGYISNVIAGVDFVTAQRTANPGLPLVANMSLGMMSPKLNSLDRAVKNSIAAGVFYAIAAGNSGVDAKNFSPAHVLEAFTVGAYDENNRLTSWSNYGSLLDIEAPGNNILSTFKGGTTATMSGTSMASPHAAGAAALLLSQNPGLSPQQVRDRLVADGKNWVTTNRKSTTGKSLYVGTY